MSYKILEQNGIDNENVDGGAFNNFASGGRDGIVGGVLSECAVTAAGSAIGISPGLLILHGIRVKVIGLETLALSSVPLNPTSYQIVAQVTLAANGDINFAFFIRTPQPLVQDSLYQNNAGVYQAEFASFTHNPDGTISDFTKTLDVIYGSGGGDVNLEVGTVTTETLAAGLDADFDVSVRREEGTNKVLLDFDAKIPRGASGVDEGAVHFNETQDLSDSQKQKAQENIGINPILEQLEDGTYNLVIGLTGDAPSAAAITQINGNGLADSAFRAYVNMEGAVLFSFNDDFSPSALFGGSWEKVTDRFPIGAGGSYTLGSTGGNATHTNTIAEMVSHNHGLPVVNNEGGYMPENTSMLRSFQVAARANNNQMNINGTATDRGPTGFSGSVGSTGDGQPFSILPPYIAVNIWRRVA